MRRFWIIYLNILLIIISNTDETASDIPTTTPAMSASTSTIDSTAKPTISTPSPQPKSTTILTTTSTATMITTTSITTTPTTTTSTPTVTSKLTTITSKPTTTTTTTPPTTTSITTPPTTSITTPPTTTSITTPPTTASITTPPTTTSITTPPTTASITTPPTTTSITTPPTTMSITMPPTTASITTPPTTTSITTPPTTMSMTMPPTTASITTPPTTTSITTPPTTASITTPPTTTSITTPPTTMSITMPPTTASITTPPTTTSITTPPTTASITTPPTTTSITTPPTTTSITMPPTTTSITTPPTTTTTPTTITTTTTTPTTITTTTTTLTTTTTIPTTTPTPSYFVGSENVTWHPTFTEDAIVYADFGYKISVTVTECNFEENEYATISTGKTGETVMIEHYVTNNSALFFNNNVLYVNFNGTSASNFTVVFTRIGEAITTTTTEITTTTVFLPTPSVNESSELTVHLTGMNPFEYRDPDIIMLFKEMIASMAREYCLINEFILLSNITTDNVIIHKIMKCTRGWPTCNPCVEVIFSVPINLKETNISMGYQLNTAHLQIMWSRYSQKYLDSGISTCEQPDINNWIKWNIIAIAILTGIILLFLLILRYYINKLAKNAARSKRQLSDGAPVLLVEERTSEIELPPHYLQEMPKLFDSAYPMYNPDVGTTNLGFEQDYEETTKQETENILSDDEDEIGISCA